MKYSRSLGDLAGETILTPINYDVAGTNSNSVIDSALSSIGINLSEQTPVSGGDYSWDADQTNDITSPKRAFSDFPGMNWLFSGNGVSDNSDTLYGCKCRCA